MREKGSGSNPLRKSALRLAEIVAPRRALSAILLVAILLGVSTTLLFFYGADLRHWVLIVVLEGVFVTLVCYFFLALLPPHLALQRQKRDWVVQWTRFLLIAGIPFAILFLFWQPLQGPKGEWLGLNIMRDTGVFIIGLILGALCLRIEEFTTSHLESIRRIERDLGLAVSGEDDYTDAVKRLTDSYIRHQRPADKEFVIFAIELIERVHFQNGLSIVGSFAQYKEILCTAARRARSGLDAVLPIVTTSVRTILELDTLMDDYYHAIRSSVAPSWNKRRWIIVSDEDLENHNCESLELLLQRSRDLGLIPYLVHIEDVRKHLLKERDFMIVDHGTERELAIEGTFALADSRVVATPAAGIPQGEALGCLDQVIEKFRKGEIDKKKLIEEIESLPVTISVRLKPKTGNEGAYISRLASPRSNPEFWTSVEAIKQRIAR
jgi:hypothetical protein